MFYRTKPRLQQGLHLDNMMKSETINHRSQGKGLQYSEHFFQKTDVDVCGYTVQFAGGKVFNSLKKKKKTCIWKIDVEVILL